MSQSGSGAALALLSLPPSMVRSWPQALGQPENPISGDLRFPNWHQIPSVGRETTGDTHPTQGKTLHVVRAAGPERIQWPRRHLSLLWPHLLLGGRDDVSQSVPECPTAPFPWELLPPSPAPHPSPATEPFFTMGHSLQGRGYWKDLKK